MAASGTTLSHRLEGELDIVSLPGKQDNTVSADCFIGGEQDNTVWADCFIAGEQDNTVSADKTAQGRAMLHYGRRTGVSGGGSDNTVSFAASGIAFFHCRRPGQHSFYRRRAGHYSFIGWQQDSTVSRGEGWGGEQIHCRRAGQGCCFLIGLEQDNSVSLIGSRTIQFHCWGAGQHGFREVLGVGWGEKNTVLLSANRTT